MKYGVGRGRIFSIRVIAELYRQIAVMEKLVKLNDERKQLNPEFLMKQRIYNIFIIFVGKCISWLMTVSSKHLNTITKNYLQFVYHIQSRFTSVGTLNKTSESIRKKPV